MPYLWRADEASEELRTPVSNRRRIGPMATAVKKLDLEIGELIEVAGRRYEAVPDREGGLILEPAITPVSELYAERGWEPAPEEDFRRLTADDEPADGEG